MTDPEVKKKSKRPVAPSVLARRARAEELRPVVASWVEMLGAGLVAERAEQKPDAVRAFVRGAVTPQPGAIDAYEEMLEDELWAARISREIKNAEDGADG